MIAAFWITYLIGWLVSWPFLARKILRDERYSGPADSTFFGFMLALVWPFAMAGMLVMRFISRPEREPEPPPPPPEQGPFR